MASERLRLLVTGARGKVGRAVADAAVAAGHRVMLTDVAAPAYGPDLGLPYIRADLTDFGQAVGALARARPQAVVHTAAIPDPVHDPAHVVFATNTTIAFNVAEAVAQLRVPRLVSLSSETVPGFVTPERPFLPDYLPVDEAHLVRPQDAYALSKSVSEHIIDALVRRADVTAVSVRASLVFTPDMYRDFLTALQAAPLPPIPNQWSYVDVRDLADLILAAAAAATAGHEVVYAAQPDNLMGLPLAEMLTQVYGQDAPPLRSLDRPDASGIRIAKARAMFGWSPKRSWRDELG
jgi:nucleoside-diphosphate-sugar epimerase